MDAKNREVFELLCIYCSRFSELVPLTFLIGFYVSEVVSRWWDIFMALPFPDKVALKLISYVSGKVMKFEDELYYLKF